MRRHENRYFDINLFSNKLVLRSSYNINRNAIIINSYFLIYYINNDFFRLNNIIFNKHFNTQVIDDMQFST